MVVSSTKEDSDGSGTDNDNVSNSGAVYVYKKNGGTWGTPIRLKSDNIDVNDGFGWQIALSADGNTLAVGSPTEDSDASGVDNNNASSSGAVYIFKYTGGVWSAPTRLKSNNIEASDNFGYSVALNSDGTILAVGANQEDSDGSGTDNNNVFNAGAVYVFEYTSAWGTPTRLKANNVGEHDGFGYSVALSGDGNTLVVGTDREDSDASGTDNNNAIDAGAVYVFKNTGTWGAATRLKADNAEADDRFGAAISLSSDGNTLVVGADREGSDAIGVDNNNSLTSGAVYVFQYSGTWSAPTRLKADNVGSVDRFGSYLSLSGDGTTLAVGAFLEDSDASGVDNDNSSASGAAYVFRNTGGTWNVITRLKADNIESNDYFGKGVSLNGDGNILVIGADREDSDGSGADNNNVSKSGAVYVFE